MTTQARVVARERQLDWLLGEVLGDAHTALTRPRVAVPWLAAALALFALSVAVALGITRTPSTDEAQHPAEPVWHECHGPAELPNVPTTVTHLRCFDFTDAACDQLGQRGRQGTLPTLTHLDLSGMDVDARGVSSAIHITDTGVRELASLTTLRWLSFAQCHDVKGTGYAVLEGMPKLEHLDVTYSGIESPAVERLARLPSLRTLVLSACMDFHGRSLTAIAKIPGLRRLELRACTTLAAADVLPLVALKELRHLDLADCQGHFRGQRSEGFGGKFVDTDGDGLPDSREEPPPPPVEDGIGITDEVVAALAALPLQTLRLGGCESLTDAIGSSLAKMTTLQVLDLANLPKTGGALLTQLPAGLQELSLDDNPQHPGERLAALPPLPDLHVLSLAGLPQLDDTGLTHLLRGRDLRTLRLGGGERYVGKADRPRPRPLTEATLAAIRAQTHLQSLALSKVRFEWPNGLAVVAALPELRELAVTDALAADFSLLASARHLTALNASGSGMTPAQLRSLAALPLVRLDLQRTPTRNQEVQEIVARQWPGCRVTLANWRTFQAPPPPTRR